MILSISVRLILLFLAVSSKTLLVLLDNTVNGPEPRLTFIIMKYTNLAIDDNKIITNEGQSFRTSFVTNLNIDYAVWTKLRSRKLKSFSNRVRVSASTREQMTTDYLPLTKSIDFATLKNILLVPDARLEHFKINNLLFHMTLIPFFMVHDKDFSISEVHITEQNFQIEFDFSNKLIEVYPTPIDKSERGFTTIDDQYLMAKEVDFDKSCTDISVEPDSQCQGLENLVPETEDQDIPETTQGKKAPTNGQKKSNTQQNEKLFYVCGTTKLFEAPENAQLSLTSQTYSQPIKLAINGYFILLPLPGRLHYFDPSRHPEKFVKITGVETDGEPVFLKSDETAPEKTDQSLHII